MKQKKNEVDNPVLQNLTHCNSIINYLWKNLSLDNDTKITIADHIFNLVSFVGRTNYNDIDRIGAITNVLLMHAENYYASKRELSGKIIDTRSKKLEKEGLFCLVNLSLTDLVNVLSRQEVDAITSVLKECVCTDKAELERQVYLRERAYNEGRIKVRRQYRVASVIQPNGAECTMLECAVNDEPTFQIDINAKLFWARPYLQITEEKDFNSYNEAREFWDSL